MIGMPVGFVGVPESKRRLASTSLNQIRLEGTRGGAGLVGGSCEPLCFGLRRSCSAISAVAQPLVIVRSLVTWCIRILEKIKEVAVHTMCVLCERAQAQAFQAGAIDDGRVLKAFPSLLLF